MCASMCIHRSLCTDVHWARTRIVSEQPSARMARGISLVQEGSLASIQV